MATKLEKDKDSYFGTYEKNQCINYFTDEEKKNPLYPMIKAEIKAKERAEAREKEEIDKRIIAEKKIADIELKLRLLKNS